MKYIMPSVYASESIDLIDWKNLNIWVSWLGSRHIWLINQLPVEISCRHTTVYGFAFYVNGHRSSFFFRSCIRSALLFDARNGFVIFRCIILSHTERSKEGWEEKRILIRGVILWGGEFIWRKFQRGWEEETRSEETGTEETGTEGKKVLW